MPSVLKLIVAVLFLSILPAQVYALTPGQVFNKVKDSIVVVKTLDAQGKVTGQGSGVLLPSGKIATNCHVVEGGTFYQVGLGKQLIPATLYAEDGDKDVCLLDAKGLKGKPAQLGKAAGLKIGVPVYAVGAPRGLELSLSDGIVAQLRGGPPPLIQTTVSVSPGSSGGGLFDGEGRLVGLTTLYIEGGQSLNFAIPVEWIGEVKQGRKLASEGLGQTEWIKRAIALQNMKDWQGMLDWCRKWTGNKPEDAYAWVNLGIAYYGLNRYNEAIEAYRQAIRIKQDYASAWDNLGLAYYRLDHYIDAIDAFRQAIVSNPMHTSALNNLGNLYFTLYQFNEAIEAYRLAIRINPEEDNTWNSLGLAYGRLRRHNDAIDAFRQALRINPENAQAWATLALSCALSGNRSAALEAVQKLRRLDPKKAEEIFNLIVPR